MFTIKYRTYQMAPKQSAGSPIFYDEIEMIHGPFELVSKEVDENGYPVVNAHKAGGAPGMVFNTGTVAELIADWDPKTPKPPRSSLWVMNEQGATVAKYEL